MEKGEAYKMDRQNEKCSCARKSGRRKNNTEAIKKKKRNWLRRNCLLKHSLEQRFSKCGPGTLTFHKELLGVPPIPDVKLFTFSSL